MEKVKELKNAEDTDVFEIVAKSVHGLKNSGVVADYVTVPDKKDFVKVYDLSTLKKEAINKQAQILVTESEEDIKELADIKVKIEKLQNEIKTNSYIFAIKAIDPESKSKVEEDIVKKGIGQELKEFIKELFIGVSLESVVSYAHKGEIVDFANLPEKEKSKFLSGLNSVQQLPIIGNASLALIQDYEDYEEAMKDLPF